MNEDWASAKHWFENEWKPIFGIDVYARPFPTARGWDIYENEHARALLIRVEDFDKLAEALGALYGIEPSTFHIQTTNTAATKDCAGHNEHIKKNFTLSDEELGRTYGTRHVQHFYSPDEIARYKLAFFITHARWRHADRVQVQVSTVRPDGLVVLRVAAESCRRYEPPFFEHPVKSAALGH